MPCTVVVVLRALPGRGEELVGELRALQPRVRSFDGFRSITLLRDQGDGDRVFEIESWDDAASHRAMVDALSREGRFDALDSLVDAEPDVHYLDELASAHGREPQA